MILQLSLLLPETEQKLWTDNVRYNDADIRGVMHTLFCLLYTSDAADE